MVPWIPRSAADPPVFFSQSAPQQPTHIQSVNSAHRGNVYTPLLTPSRTRVRTAWGYGGVSTTKSSSTRTASRARFSPPTTPSVAHIWGDGQSGGLSLEQRGDSPLRPLRMPILQVEELGSKSASYSADEPTPPRPRPQPTLRHVNSMRAALLSGRITGAEDGAEDRVVTRKAEGGAEVTL